MKMTRINLKASEISEISEIKLKMTRIENDPNKLISSFQVIKVSKNYKK